MSAMLHSTQQDFSASLASYAKLQPDDRLRFDGWYDRLVDLAVAADFRRIVENKYAWLSYWLGDYSPGEALAEDVSGY